MTEQDHIDAMLAKLRERIPGLEWEQRQELVEGSSPDTAAVVVLIYHDRILRVWRVQSGEPIGTSVDAAIDGVVSMMRASVDELLRALKGAK